MPWLEVALDRRLAEAILRRTVSLGGFADGLLKLSSVRLLRHRPGRRAVIEYTFDGPSRGARWSRCLVGKCRAKGLDRETIRVMSDLYENGFSADSPDGISVPEVVAVVPEWQMWLSPKIEGVRATDLLFSPGATHLARRIADAARRIHESRVATRRRHSLSDELAVLDAALAKASSALPGLAQRIAGVARAGRAMALSSCAGRAGSIHRDFYADQIVVAGDRLFVLDLDQFGEGDVELDIGNFMGHITELTIRRDGDSRGLDEVRDAMCERAVEWGASRELIMTYDLLTLARHIWISTRIADRNHVTVRILGECEERLQLAGLEIRA